MKKIILLGTGIIALSTSTLMANDLDSDYKMIVDGIESNKANISIVYGNQISMKEYIDKKFEELREEISSRDTPKETVTKPALSKEMRDKLLNNQKLEKFIY